MSVGCGTGVQPKVLYSKEVERRKPQGNKVVDREQEWGFGDERRRKEPENKAGLAARRRWMLSKSVQFPELLRTC